jgi:hypothetical protein
MTDQQHPITPPCELRNQWREEAPVYRDFGVGREDWLIDRATQWGADQELEACLEHLFRRGFSDADILCLHAARRPKLPSLKQQALALVEQHEDGWRPAPKDWDTIRRALEALPND